MHDIGKNIVGVVLQCNNYEVIDLGVDQGIIKKSGSWFSYGDTKLGQGRDAVKNLLADNPELMEELENKIKEAIRPTQVEEVMPEEALA